MAHERDDEYEAQEDGEYHFSDDQANYEVEPDVAKSSPAAAPKSVVAGLGSKPFKRPLIGVGVFLVVVFLVYKIITPSATTPATDFSQNTSAPAKAITTTPVEKTTVVTTTTTSKPLQQAAVTPEVIAPPPQVPVTVTTVTTPIAPPVTVPQQQTIVQAPPAQPYQAPPVETAQVTQQQGASTDTSSQAIDKLIALQDQNTKLVTQLQTESAQKISEYEAQNNEMQGKLQEMAARISTLEATINRLTREGGRAPASVMPMQQQARVDLEAPAVAMARPAQVKAMFSVQAIIPGRAWLKSENGETVTVAEGDILKNYGKIIKIDPYDGVVQIDASGRVVTLSYGASAE
jgi:hypothetical protein